MRTRSSRDSWERLVAAVIKRDQIRQLCHQDSITTVDSDFSTQRDLSLRSVHSSPSQLSLTKDFVNVEVRKNGSRSITQKLFSAVLWRKKPKDYDLGKGSVGIPEGHFRLESFFLHELQIATEHFSNKNFIGHGGFGKLYKGRLEDGSLVVVKRLPQVMIGEELEISSIVAHRNIIGLRGFCNTEHERLLVYPYMANRSVASCLRERRDSQPPLEWASRSRIALGVARGLDHLHRGCIRSIIHGDVKAANILLDDDFEAIVSNFTFTKFMNGIDGNGVRGTIGHIASEYLSTGKCSLETDVFSYGVFLLELITRQRAFDLAMLGDDEDTLPYWVKKFLEEKTIEIMGQQDLEANFVEEEVKKLLQIALICTLTDQERRPTMSGIVRILEDEDGLAEAWEEVSKNVNQDQNYFSAMWNHHSSHNGIDDHIPPDGIDVYGYGAFLLELITTQRVFDLARLANDMTLHDWVKKLLEEKKFEIMVDRDLEGNFVEEEVEKLLRIALICRQTDPKGRPMMSEVVRMLEDGDGLGEAWEEFSQSVLTR